MQVVQRASTAIRKIISKVRNAMPENFDQLKEELAQTLAKDFEACGPQKAKVQEEADKALEAASAKVETMLEQRKQQEIKLKEMEQKRKEAEEKAQELLKGMSEMLEEAEEAAKEFQETVAGFVEDSGKTKDAVAKATATVDKAAKTAEERAQKCADFLKENGSAMKVGTVVKKGKEDGADEKKAEQDAPTFQKSSLRMTVVKQKNDKTSKEYVVAKEKAVQKATANEVVKKTQTLFTKYDKDKDGALSRKEIELFAKGEYKFTMPADQLDLILKAIVQPDGSGVKLADFQRLKVATGVARERAKDQAKRAAREKKEKMIADQKAEIQTTIDAALAKTRAAEDESSQVSKQVMGLAKEKASMQSPAMLRRATELDALKAAARDKLAEAQKDIGGLGDGVDMDVALAPWLKVEKAKLEGRAKNLNTAMNSVEGTLKKFRDEAAHKDASEVQELSKKARTLLQSYQAVHKLPSRELFAAIDAGKAGSVKVADFVAFLMKAQEEAEKAKAAKKEEEEAEKDEAATKEGEAAEKSKAQDKDKDKGAVALSDEDFTRAFAAFDDEEEGILSVDNFVAHMRQMKKVVKDIIITSSITIKESKTLRRLEIDEVVEILEGPTKEGDMQRVRAVAIKDGVEGWVTIEGNQGSIYLKDGGGVYKVVKETILTESFDIGAPKEETRKIKETSRKLKVGELLDVREWEKKDEKSGLTRMKFKVRQDGLVGYVTTLGNTGIRFVEAV